MSSHSLLGHRMKCMMEAVKDPEMNKCLDDHGTTLGGKMISTINKCLDDGTTWSMDLLV